MGFVTGFTGGVTVTLSLAYLSVLAHQRTREHQGQLLRSQALAVQGLVDPLPPLPPPTRSEVAAAQRANAVEVAKDRWNQEVNNATRWVQNTDWVQVREGLEDRASSLWRSAFGGSPDVQAKSAIKDGAAAAEETSSKVVAVAKEAFERGKAAAAVVIENTKEAVAQVEDSATTTTLSPVQKALQQRYAKPEAKVNKTVAEALEERYKPVDGRDNSNLRGV